MYKVGHSILFIFISLSVFGQDDLCFENSQGLYWPIQVGQKFKYGSGNVSYTSYFPGDSIKFGDNYFLKEIQEYSNGKVKELYWRQKNGIVYFYDTEKQIESIELVNELIPGTAWFNGDKTWKYTIIDTVSSFATPFCEFNKLLQIRAEPKRESTTSESYVYNLFYKRGVGLVGLNINGTAHTYIKPSKKLNEKSFIAYGCENLTTEGEMVNCTYKKIYDFVSVNLKPPKKKDYKSGQIVLNVIIGNKGEVENIKIVETIPNATLQENEVIRVVKMLPKFIPGQFDDGHPVRLSFRLPVKF